MEIKCAVACCNSHGIPSLYFLKVECTQAQYDFGGHYSTAAQMATEEDYERPFVVFDQHDYKDIMTLCSDWSKVPTICCLDN